MLYNLSATPSQGKKYTVRLPNHKNNFLIALEAIRNVSYHMMENDIITTMPA